jgi:HlyD family secretion protein
MKWKRVAWAGVPLLLVGILVFVAFSRSEPAPAPFQTAVVDRGDIVATVGATGTVEAVATVQVGSQVSGSIWKLYADFNSNVTRDQIVARLEPSLFESRLTEARANLATALARGEQANVSLEDARLKRDRAVELNAKELLPQSELDVAKLNYERAEAELKASDAQLEQARAAVSQAEVNLEHTVIRSPIDGVVISRNVDVGQTVAASFQAPTLFTIAEDLKKMRVVASVDEADVGNIAVGQRAGFRVDAFPEDDFEGEVSQVRLAPIVVQNVVTYNALVDVDNSELKLRPGMTANVTFEVARHAGVLRVPNAALRFRPDAASAPAGGGRTRNAVFVVESNGALRRAALRAGLTDGSFTEVLEGEIAEGDRLATASSEPSRTGNDVPSPMRFFGFGGRRR